MTIDPRTPVIADVVLRNDEPAAVEAVLSDDPIGHAMPLGSPA